MWPDQPRRLCVCRTIADRIGRQDRYRRQRIRCAVGGDQVPCRASAYSDLRGLRLSHEKPAPVYEDFAELFRVRDYVICFGKNLVPMTGADFARTCPVGGGLDLSRYRESATCSSYITESAQAERVRIRARCFSSPAAPASSAPTSCSTGSRATGEPVVNLDKLTYAGNLENLRRARGRPAPRLRARRHRRRARWSRALLAEHRPRAIVQLRRRVPRRPLDRRPGRRSSRPTSSAPSRCSRRRARYWTALPAAASARVPLPARLDRRGLRLARPRRPGRSRETTPYAPNCPYSASQGGVRPPRARLAPHLRPADAHHQLLEQLRPVPVPREADPADDPQRARRQAAAGLRRRPATSATGSTSTTTARRSARCSSAAAPARPTTSAATPRRRNLDVVHALCDAARRAARPRAATARELDHVRRRTGPGHDRRYAIDAAQDRARARLDAARDVRDRASRRTVRWYLDNARLGASGARAASTAMDRAQLRGSEARHDAKGIILAGGSGTRLYPVTLVVSQAAAAGLRQADDLLPAVDADAGRHPRHPDHLHAAGHAALRAAARRRRAVGHATSLRRAAAARRPGAGLHHRRATSSATTPCALVLGDNIFYGHGLAELLQRAPARARAARRSSPTTVQRSRALRRGRVRRGRAARSSIEEKPAAAEVALRGHRPLLLRQPTCVDIAATLKPSARGELEITDVNRAYLERGRARRARCWAAAIAWLDTGTHESLLEAGAVHRRRIEQRQGLKIACPEEIACRMGFIDAAQLERARRSRWRRTATAQYLLRAARASRVF